MRKKPNKGVAYRFFKSKEDFEGISWDVENGVELVIKWIASGTGQLRQPVGTIHGDKFVITWGDDAFRFWAPEVRSRDTTLNVVLAKG
jgi:hypothetical protein